MGVNTHNFHSPILEKSRGKILLFVLFLFIGAQFPGPDSNSSGPNSNSTFAYGHCLMPTYICPCSRPLLRINRAYLHNRAYLRIYRNGLLSCEYTERIHGYIGLFCRYIGLIYGHLGIWCRYAGRFCGYIGLICGCMGLFCGYTGLIYGYERFWCRCTGRFCGYTGLICGYVGLFCGYI